MDHFAIIAVYGPFVGVAFKPYSIPVIVEIACIGTFGHTRWQQRNNKNDGEEANHCKQYDFISFMSCH